MRTVICLVVAMLFGMGTAAPNAAAADNRIQLAQSGSQSPGGADLRRARMGIQFALRTLGFDPGGADGKFGPKTRRAIKAYQRSIGASATGSLSGEQALRVVEDAKRLIAQRAAQRNNARPAAAPDDGRPSFRVFPNSDLPGHDYRTPRTERRLKGIGIKGCGRACADDPRCRAFTYNQNAGWCFLKSKAGKRTAFNGATSGIKEAASATAAAAAPPLVDRPEWILKQTPRLKPFQNVDGVTVQLKDARYPTKAKVNERVTGLHSFQPLQDITVSNRHRRALELTVYQPRARYEDILAKRREADSLLADDIAELTEKLGAEHPLVGLLKIERATVLESTIEDPDDVAQVKRANEKAQAVRLEGVSNIERSVDAGTPFGVLLGGHGIRGLLRAASVARKETCDIQFADGTPNQTASDLYGRAAALHLKLFGGALTQVGLRRRQALCLSDGTARIDALRVAASLAEQLKHPLAIAWAKADLGLALHRSGDGGAARTKYRDATKSFAALPGYDEISQSAFPGGASLEALFELKLDKELDFILKRLIRNQIKNREYANNAGRSWVWALATQLEQFGRGELADGYYRHLAGTGEMHSGPLQIMSGFAGQHIGVNDYRSARYFLDRAVTKLDQVKDPRMKVRILSQLARVHHEKGEFQSSNRVARQALKIAKRNARRIDKGEMETLNRIISESSSEARQSGQVLAAMLADLQTVTQRHCLGRDPATATGPEVPVDVLAQDRPLAAAYAKSPEAEAYLKCLRQRDRRADKPNAAELRTELFLLALRDDSEAISATLNRFLDFKRWGLGLDTAALRRKMPRDFYDPKWNRGMTSAERLYLYANTFERSYAEAVFHAHEGLALAGKGDAIRPLLQPLLARYTDSRMESLLSRRYSFNAISELSRLALVLEAGGEFEASQRFYAAIKAWALEEKKSPTSGHDSCHWLEVCEYLGTVEMRLGNRKLAKEHLDWINTKYIILFSGASASPQEMDTIREDTLKIGLVRERQGLYHAAQAYYGIAWGSAFSQPDSELISSILALNDPIRSFDDVKAVGSLSRILLKTGARDTARAISAHMVDAAKKRFENSASFGSDAVIRWSGRLRSVFETHLATTPKDTSGQLRPQDDAFFATQYLQNTRTATTLAKLSARMGSVAGDIAREHQQTGAALSDAYNALVAAKSGTQKGLLRKIDALEKKSDRLAAKLREEHPAYFRHGRVQTLTLAQTRQALRQGEALLTVYVGEDAVYAWWVTREKAALFPLPLSSADVSREIAAYREGLQDLAPMTARFLKRGHALYKMLLGPVADELGSIDHILWVPNGPFDGLPLSALLTAEVGHDAVDITELRDKKLPWLIRRQTVSTLPSVAAVSILRSGTRTARASKPFLGVGNPDFGREIKVASARRVVTLNDGISIPPLPESEQEIRQLGDLLGADADRDLMVGEFANEKDIKSRSLEDYRIIAFATHGVIAGEVETLDEPALVLSLPNKPTPLNDGFLRASEITALELNADMVILSACNTASGDGVPGAEGLSGLANAFFFAGARGLIATHWFIPSEPAVAMTTATVRAKVDDDALSWAQALRRAALQQIDGPGPDLNAHPISWAAFILVGG